VLIDVAYPFARKAFPCLIMQCRQKTLNAVKRKRVDNAVRKIKRPRVEQSGEGSVVSDIVPELEFKVTVLAENTPKVSKTLRRTSQTSVYRVEHNFSKFEDMLDVGEKIDEMFCKMIQPQLDRMKDSDLFSVEVEHEHMEDPIYMSYRKKTAFDRQQFTNAIYAVGQSEHELLNQGIMTVTVASVEAP
jgi:hypothetical protein